MTFKKSREGHSWKSVQYDSEKAVRSALRQICIYVCFFFVVIILCLSATDRYMYYFNKTVQHIFLSHKDNTTLFFKNVNFEHLKTSADWWTFLEEKFLDDLHAPENDTSIKNEPVKGAPVMNEPVQNNTVKKRDTTDNSSGLIFLYENVLLGPPRLRQIRVLPDSCIVDQVFTKYFTTCYAPYDSSVEDKEPYFKSTKYHTLDDLNAYSLWGTLATYTGGGYVKDLTYDKAQNKEILAELKSNKWVDRATRMIVLELNLYNVNTGLFNSVKFIAEMSPTGGIIASPFIQALKFSSIWMGDGLLVFLAAIIFYIMLIWYTSEEIREISAIGVKNYSRSIWNIVDLMIIIFGYLSFIYNCWHWFYSRRLVHRIEANRDKFLSLDAICYWNIIYRDIMALLAFFACIKVFKYISFNKTMLQFSTTLKRCAKDLLGFGLMFTIVFLAYAQLGLLLFGTVNKDFRNFPESVLTMVRMVLGDFEYKKIEKANRVLGPIYFLTYILLVFFILLNMFLAIINETYSGVKSEIKFGDNHLERYIKRMLYNVCGRFCSSKSRGADLDTTSSQTLYPKSSTTSNENPKTSSTILSDATSEPTRMRGSDIIREYFEEVPLPVIHESEQIKSLKTRVGLLEEVLESLIGDMDRILEKVDSQKKNKFV